MFAFTKTLRLFIRNVTQVDVATSFSSHYRLRRTTPRFTTPSVRFPHPPYTRAYSFPANGQVNESVTDMIKNELGKGTSGSAQYEHEGVTGENLEDLFMEITPESIDALAAESKIEAESLSIPIPPQSTEIHDGKRKKKPRWELAPDVERTRFRSIKLDNAASASPQASTSKKSRHETNRHNKPIEYWRAHREAMKKKFPEGWKPMKKLSPEAQAGIRALHAQYPDQYTTAALSESFEVSPEAIRRILKTNWVPSPGEQSDRDRRWFGRGKSVWNRYAQLGVKPPKRWREEGIGRGKPEWKKMKAVGALTTSRAGVANPVADVEDVKTVEDYEADDLKDRIL
ncbi:Required for respiratory growth protein 9 mitochondrial [Clarireedia jacksonii]